MTVLGDVVSRERTTLRPFGSLRYSTGTEREPAAASAGGDAAPKAAIRAPAAASREIRLGNFTQTSVCEGSGPDI